ncbi:ABC transporter substrate-binding protein [Eoetvoesiella caeni]|uniref:NitT/TauT family transport system substrate-binding protein/sulfonate transport system substrate-binding protein n=1 Tax=Eoetvoesiella caeni TaxID=645616 RepID=A0A366HGR7_9BURK|nr:ABC transporter substrate-binding protein [Eoetvoesiella caeni]MCI2807842.1 ABC transporter substrate-binding protein [Eoetvoesiella caeni]NYT54156.1 ABC transporter substrate-binding protein [Eoetvoesiella caeni]RBP41759.1 NitT/TauT family transport system substrate-binding protein/sulfonate transport system substrate-binding protein [Eoetvoesiella caeni]
MKKTVQAILAGAATLIVIAPAAAADIPELRVGWTIPAEEAKYLMMKRPELFPDLGKKYTIKWTQFQGTSPMIQAMRANVLDCSTMAPMSLAQGAIESGLKAYIVAQHVYEKKGYFTVYWAVKEDSPIKSAADLKGKVLGTNAYGSGVYFNLVLWLKQNGLDPEKDVKIVETGFPPMADAIRSGRIDLGTMVQPFALLSQEKGGLRELASQAAVQTPQVQIFEGCSQDYTNKNPEVVRAYIKDLQSAMAKVQADHDLAVTVDSEVTRAPKELLGKYVMTNKDFARDDNMQPNLDSIQTSWDLYYKAGFLSKPLKISDFVRKDVIAPVK